MGAYWARSMSMRRSTGWCGVDYLLPAPFKLEWFRIFGHGILDSLPPTILVRAVHHGQPGNHRGSVVVIFGEGEDFGEAVLLILLHEVNQSLLLDVLNSLPASDVLRKGDSVPIAGDAVVDLRA